MEGRIIGLGRGGDGLVESADGRRLFAAGTVPGDRVRVRPQAGGPGSGKEGPVAADLTELLEAGAERVAAPCPHFPPPGGQGCGGCQMQMLAWPAYLDWKAGLARDALARAGVPPEQVPAPVVAPERSRRRAGFALLRQPDGVRIGFRGRRSHRVEDLSDACLVCAPELLAVLPPLRALGAELLRPGQALAVQATATEGGLDLVLRGAAVTPPDVWPQLVDFAETADLARLSTAADDRRPAEPVLLRRTPLLRFGPVPVVPAPGGFLQAVAAIEARMQADVAGWLDRASRILDLYAGCGTLSLPLVDAATIHAVDGDKTALAALQAGADAAGRGGRVGVQARDLARFPLVGPDLAGYDAAILDPPRQGAAEQAAALASAAPAGLRRLAAVSCNPVTLARDLERLFAGGWRLGAVRLYDQFLWTPHLEVVALLER
ncbi:class I SAM-dependent RNA methyltransferase [Marinibaculum pumilum]|uniref:Class I SAM-dependent RNA methyltransferase n=1 Tax=Marinibaculum pumilum TaxID=1766165 RepID=A0ABV7LA51_9PROT